MAIRAEGQPIESQREFTRALRASLIDDLVVVRQGGIVRISTLEANPALYNDSRVIAALQDAKYADDARIFVITGPIFVVDETGFNGLLHLKRNGTLDGLCCCLTRAEVIDDMHLVETDRGFRYRLDRPVLVTARRAVQEISQDFDETLQRLKQPSDIVNDLPFLATESGLFLLQKEAQRQGVNLDALDPKEIYLLPNAQKYLLTDESMLEFRNQARLTEQKRKTDLIGQINLPEITRAVSLTTRGIPCVEIELPRSNEIKPTVLAVCEFCGGNRRFANSNEDFPFPALGIKVRFLKLPVNVCDECGLVTSSEQIGLQVEAVLRQVTQKLEGTKPILPSPEDIRQRLGL